MNISILPENVAGGRLFAEYGVSYFIETDNEKILFDAGHSNVFSKKTKTLGININNDVDKVVLSHGQWNHIDGCNCTNR